MRKTAFHRILSLLLGSMLALAPVSLLAAVYKCERDNQLVYSDVPCGEKIDNVKSKLSVVPPYPVNDGSPKPWTLRGLLSALGLDSTGGLIALLVFTAPLSIVIVFFFTRKSESKSSSA